MEKPRTTGRWFQFSLRTMFVCVTLLAFLSAWPGPEVVRRLQAWWSPQSFDQIRRPLHGIKVELFDPNRGEGPALPEHFSESLDRND